MTIHLQNMSTVEFKLVKFIICVINLGKPVPPPKKKPIINLPDDLIIYLSKSRCIFQNIMCHVIHCLFLKYQKHRLWIQSWLALKSDFLFTRNVTMRIIFKVSKPQFPHLCDEVQKDIIRSFLCSINACKLFLCVSLPRTRKREVTKKAWFLPLWSL